MPDENTAFSLSSGTVLHWFRRALREHDNIALRAACSACREQGAALLHVFVLDERARRGVLRTQFLRESLLDLDKRLRERGSRLYVAIGDAEKVIPEIAHKFRASTLMYERETAGWARKRDSDVCKVLKKRNIEIHSYSGHTLYEPERLIKAHGGTPPTSMTALQASMDTVGPPNEPCEAEEGYPPPPEGVLEGGDDEKHGLVPSLQDLGMSLDGFHYRYRGGESAALERMAEFLQRNGGQDVAKFVKPNTSPAEYKEGHQDTTVLSPHLALGTLSPRVFYYEVCSVQARFKTVSEPPTSLLGQLMFRELFHILNENIPNFEKMEGNRFCRQVDWDTDDKATQRWQRWEAAQTGYPWIDALMMQLRTEGFVHHLGRHSLACFLTRGDLWVSWERGQETFERYLIDWDEALNAGNWMWLAASAFFSAYHRVYSPVAFAKRWSAAPQFIRNYLPVLSKVPDKYIFEPWKMPKNLAREADIEVGKDYPFPMCDHGTASKENIARMSAAYGKAKNGKDSTTAIPGKSALQKRSSGSQASESQKRSREGRRYKMSK